MLSRIGRYEVLAEVGRGGFGHVYRCLDPVLGTQVAIKILMGDGDARMLTRFRNEAATSRKLTHPNIVTIYDFGDQDGQAYIVMELLEGQDLQVVIESRMPVSLLEKVEIMNQVAAGLGHAHANGILHRDIKPANVMLLHDHSVKIMDFGIALITRSSATRVTPQGSMIGTMRYLAPEQFREDKPDSRSDIFAYGLVSYELLGGTHPFQATDPASLMYSILRDEPAPIGSIVPECAGPLEAIVERLLQKDPDLRYQSLEDVQLDLGTVLSELREQRASSLLEQAKAANATGELERARELTREVLALVPGHRTARMLREQLQTELRRKANRPRLDELVQQGRRALTAGNPVEAQKKFESALALEPTDSGLQDLLREARLENERRSEAAQTLARAEAAFKANDFAGAILLSEDALQLAPRLVGAQALNDRAEAAFAEEQRTIRLAGQVAKAQELIDSHSWDFADLLLSELLAEFPDEAVLSRLSDAVVEGRRTDQAKRELAAGLVAARKQVDSGDWNGAAVRLEQLARAFPESAEARTLLGEARRKIDSEWRREFVEGKLAEVERLEARKEFAAALRVLDSALVRYPADSVVEGKRRAVVAAQERAQRLAVEAAQAQAEAHRAQGRFPEAVEALDAAVKSLGRDKVLLEARQLIVQEQAAARRAALVDDFARRANTEISKWRFDAALEILNRAPDDVRGHDEIKRLRDAASAQLRARDEEARRLCERARALLQPDPVRALELLRAAAEPLRMRPDVEELAKSAGEAVEKAETRRARIAAIRGLASEQRFGEAERAAQDASVAYRGDPEAAELLEEIRESRRRSELARVAEREEERRDARRVLTARAGDLMAKQSFDEAERAVQADLAAHRDDLEITNLLVEVRDRRRRREVELEELRRAEERRSLAAKAGELLDGNRFSEAERAILGGLAAQPGDPELSKLLADVRGRQKQAQDTEKRRAERLAFTVGVNQLVAARRFEDAERALGDRLTAHPDDLEMTDLLAAVRGKRQKWDAEQAAQEEQRRREARQALTTKVKDLATKQRFAEAGNAIQSELGARPGDAELETLLADVQRQHRKWAAEQAAILAAQEEKRREEARRAISGKVDKLLARHGFDEAERAIQNGLAAQADDRELAKLLADVRERRRIWDAEQEAEARRKRIETIRGLASGHRFDEAERSVQDALAAEPGEPELTALNFEVRGQHRQWEAEQAAARAAQELDRRREAQRVLVARIRELLAKERFDEADRALEQALADDPESAELAEVRDSLAETRREWSAKQAEIEVQRTLARIRNSMAGQPGQAVTELEALARQYAGREEIQSLLAEARQRQAKVEEEARRKRAEDAIRAAAALRGRNPKRALKELERLPQPVRDRTEVRQAIEECRGLIVEGPPAPAWRRPVILGPAVVVLAAGAAWLLTKHPFVSPPVFEHVAIEIATDPSGVTVTAGGLTCVTPACFLELGPGTYRVVAKRDGYEAAEQTLTVVAGKRTEPMLLTMKPVIVAFPATPGVASGTLSVRAGIANALVFIDEAPAGRTKADGSFSTKVKAASHLVRVEKTGFDTPAAKRVTVGEDKPTQVGFTLTAQEAKLELRGAPAGVEIRAGGALLGKTTGGAFSAAIPPGAKTLRFTLGADSNELAQVFDPGRTVALEWASVGPAAKPVAAKEPPPPPAMPAVDPAEQAWESARVATNAAVLLAFVQRFPNGPHTAEAQAKIELLEWSHTGANDASALRAYLSRFPTGAHAREAAGRLDEIAWNEVDKNSVAALRDFTAQNSNSGHLGEARAAISQFEKAGEQARVDTAQQQRAIRATLNQVNAAFQRRQKQEFLQVWTNPMKDLADSVAAGTAVTFEPAGPAEIKGDSASIVCVYSITIRGRANPAKVRLTLKKSGDRWVIDGPFGKP